MNNYTSTFHLSFKSPDDKKAARVMKNIITAMEESGIVDNVELTSLKRAYIAQGPYEQGADIEEKELLR